MAPLLQAENVSMSFGGVKALSDVSFDLHDGEILGLIGPNGAGKTTMFNCITGVLPGYRGRIRYDGRDLRHLKPHERARLKIARTFQNLELFDELSALDNLLVPLDAFSRRGLIGDLLRLPPTLLDERRAQEEARSILHFLSLGDYADTPQHPNGRNDELWMKHSLWYAQGNRLDYKPVNLKPLTVESIPPKVRTF